MKTYFENKDLLLQFTQREITNETKGSAMGAAWLVLKPLFLLGLYVFVFGYIFDGKFSERPEETQQIHAIGIFVGLNVIHFLADILGTCPRCVVDNSGLVKRTVLPLELLPVSQVGKAGFEFLVTSTLMIVGLLVFGLVPGVNALWFFPLTISLIFLGLGIAYLLATIGVYFRDITQVTQVASMGLLFASAVFYSVDMLKQTPVAWSILQFNPALILIDAFRSTILWNEPLHFGTQLVYYFAFCISTYILGFFVFEKNKKKFADHM
ncbi:ABC transporter permease [Puniceicoccaceae bacterium K14]|nr:ABC transporter permease [Puniceicoccaceae bacterium K14]